MSTLKKTLSALIILLTVYACNPFTYLEKEHASKAQTYIRMVYDQSKLYVVQGGTGTVPSTVDEMIAADLLDLDQSVYDQWDIILGLTYDEDLNKIGGAISAISTDKMPGGIGKEVCFDVENKIFGGYGSSYECGESN